MLAKDLLGWYTANRRPLPWREGNDPYRIWVSEIMLQQTTVAAVVPYFEKWMTRFPSVEVLASATEQDVLALWQGLGYYRRCRNLLDGARRIAQHGWPKGAIEWRKVPGVGRYTAGAIASIALGEAVPVVDGNVERVYARLTVDDSSGAELNRAAWRWAEKHVPSASAGDWNQALMELGATICRPTAPICDLCPVVAHCSAHSLGAMDAYPKPTEKPIVRQLAFHVWIPFHCGKFGVKQITSGEWWEGMWEFPRFAESTRPEWLVGEVVQTFKLKHTVTNHQVTLQATLVRAIDASGQLEWWRPDLLESVPMPAPQRKLARLASEAMVDYSISSD